MNKLMSILCVMFAASLALTACGAGASAAPTAMPAATIAPTAVPPTTAPTAVAVPLSMELSDSGVTPNAFSAPQGAHVTFTVKNTGTAERDCVFFDVATMKLYPGQAQWSLTQIAAGATKSLEFDTPAKTASYKIDCGTAGFSGQPRTPTPGLTGTLDVK